MQRKGNLLALVAENANWYSHSEKQYGSSLKTFYPIALLGILYKGYKNTDLKGYMHPDVYSNSINNSHTTERAEMSIN